MVDVPVGHSLELLEQELIEVGELNSWEIPQGFLGFFAHLAEALEGSED